MQGSVANADSCTYSDLGKSHWIHNHPVIIRRFCMCNEESLALWRHSRAWRQYCSLVRPLDECSTCWGHAAPHPHLKCRRQSLVQSLFEGEWAWVFWFYGRWAQRHEDIPWNEPSLLLHSNLGWSPTLHTALTWFFSRCCSICFLRRKQNWVISSSSYSFFSDLSRLQSKYLLN